MHFAMPTRVEMVVPVAESIERLGMDARVVIHDGHPVVCISMQDADIIATFIGIITK